MKIRKFRAIGVLAFAAIMAVGAFIGLLFFCKAKKVYDRKKGIG